MSFTAVDPLAALAALVYLVIALVAARRSGDVPLARPLAFFALGLFAYVFFEQGTARRASGILDAIENATASLTFIPAVEFLLTFAGRSSHYRWLRLAALGFYVPLAAYCFVPSFQIEVWEHWMLLGLLFFFGGPGWVLVDSYRRSGPVERGRTLLLLGALLLGAVGAASALLISYGAPSLLHLGLVGAGLLLAALMLDPEMLRGASRLSAVTAAVFALVVVAGELVLFSIRERTGALFLAGTTALVLVAFAALRPIFSAGARDRERTQHLSTLGSLAAQMQHDLLNPLTAISANVQFLQEERRLGHTIDDQEEVLDAILGQVDRLTRIIRDYRRLSRVEPHPAPVQVGRAVTEIVEGQRATLPGIDLVATVPAELGDFELELDRDLLATALENLMRNAYQAITEHGEGSRIEVRLTKGGHRLALTVTDDGPGMDPRTVEQACNHYFTTRATGTGLGLSYASRVAEAHGGELMIESIEGRGTTVTLWFPMHIPGWRSTPIILESGTSPESRSASLGARNA